MQTQICHNFLNCSNVLQDLECGICKDLAEDAVHCKKCKNILCASHKSRLKKCPYCNSVLIYALKIDLLIEILTRKAFQLPIQMAENFYIILKDSMQVAYW